jgi:hypothetical protein
LNDLSLMPPVSVTMHPRNLPPAAAPLAAPDAAADVAAELAALDAAGALEAGALLLRLEELLPHAATSRAAAPAAATVATKEVCLTVFPSHWTRYPTPRPDKGVP